MSKHFILIVFISILVPGISHCQNQEAQVNTFSSRLSNPLKIEVSESERGTVVFRVRNDSWFTYHIELKFGRLENLSPATNSYKDIVPPGTKTFFTLKILDPKSLHNYSYSFKYGIGDPGKTADGNFQYMLPLSNGKKIKLLEIKNSTGKTFFRNIFQLENGDTIFCMRKGLVTATFGNYNQSDRVHQTSSVEVLHADGTIGVYDVSGNKEVLVAPGQTVYPLQPLAVIQNSGTLSISLFRLENSNMLRSFTFKYEGESEDKTIMNNSTVNHLTSDIEKELTRKEEKRFAKGKLYD
jgi:hypothetical protein